MAHRFEEIAASAIDLSERHEGATEVVSATLAQPKRSEIIVQLLRRFLRGALSEVARRDDEIDRGRRSTVGSLEAGRLPLAEDAGQGRVDRYTSRHLRLRLLQGQAAERLKRLVVLPPAQTCSLSVTKAAEGLERIEDASVLRDAPIGDQLLDLFAGVDRGDPPGWILVDLLRKDAALKHTGSRFDQLFRNRRAEQRRGQVIDVVDRSRRELPFLSEPQDELAQVARTNLVQLHAANMWKHVEIHP